MKLHQLLDKKYFKLERSIYLEMGDDYDMTIKFLPNFWAKEKGSKYDYGIEINFDEKTIVFCREEFEDFLEELEHFRWILEQKIIPTKNESKRKSS